MPRILLLSAYHAASHDLWCRGLMENFPQCQWTLMTLPPRHFSWRIRGNSLSWSFSHADQLQQAYDLVIATSMVDLATLRGLNPGLAGVPTLVYFHENQFAYPVSPDQHPSLEPCMVNLYTALCGDRVVFNSHYNRETFLEGVALLLSKMPDAVPPGVVDILNRRSSVIPVPLADSCFAPSTASVDGPLTLVWNHRWEYDKAPERLFAALQQLPDGLNLRVHVLGQQFRRTPAVMNQLYELLQARRIAGHWGFVAQVSDYLRLLRESHGVISTALHDFQGLAVLEAVAAGCVPLVPQRLAYPEWFGSSACYASDPADVQHEAAALADAIVSLARQHSSGQSLSPVPVEHFAWRQCGDKYLALFHQLGLQLS